MFQSCRRQMKISTKLLMTMTAGENFSKEIIWKYIDYTKAGIHELDQDHLLNHNLGPYKDQL